MENETFILDEKIVRRLETKIISMENEFLRNPDKSDSKMVEKIKKLIEEEVECNSNR
jgi:hypothetical protein